jgi:hypothetical protein
VDYCMLATRAPGEDDGRLYPVPGHESGTVALEPLDGEPLRLTGSGVSIYELVADGCKSWLRLRHIKADLLITESRVVVACSKYDKAGRWWRFGAGGAALAPPPNGARRSLAAECRDGKMLVGHVRYPWLRCVGYKPKTGWASNEELRVGVVVQARDGAKRQLFLDVRLPRNVNSSAVARAIVTRTARYRLKHTEIEGDTHRTAYERLADAAELGLPEPKKFALYQLPTYFAVNAATAYPSGSFGGLEQH